MGLMPKKAEGKTAMKKGESVDYFKAKRKSFSGLKNVAKGCAKNMQKEDVVT
jgi:hypothetical protein